MKPLVSIIATFYNSEKFIFNAMNCLLNQTYRNIEFICVNDGSKDKTGEILSEFEEKDARIIIINKTNEKAAHYARAAGQDIARGKYCFLFDHDDTISLNLIESAVNELESIDYDMVSPTVVSNLNKKEISFKLAEPISGIEAFKKTIGGWRIHMRSIMKREVFQSVSYRDLPHALLNGDEYIDRKIILNAKSIGSCAGFYYYNPPSSSETRKSSPRLLDELETNMLLRTLLKSEKFYTELGYSFELSSLKHLIKMVYLLIKLKKDISEEEYKEKLELLKQAYKNINKNLILEKTESLGVKIYYHIILSNFFIFRNVLYVKNKLSKRDR